MLNGIETSSEWSTFFQDGHADLFQGKGWLAGELTDIVMSEPWIFLVGLGPDALRVQLTEHVEDTESHEARDLTRTLVAQLRRGYSEAGLASDELLMDTTLVSPVRDIATSVLSRMNALRELRTHIAVELVRPKTVSMPQPPATSRALADLLATSPALSRSLFVLDAAEGRLHADASWSPLGDRILLKGRRSRSDIADRFLDTVAFGSMVAARGRVAVTRGMFGVGWLSVLSRGRALSVTGLREPRHSYDLNLDLRSQLTAHVDSAFREPLRWLLPGSVVEGFEAGVNCANKYLKYGAPKMRVGLSLSNWNAIWLGLARECGTIAWGVQHGGAYGEMAQHSATDSERIQSDVFVSAGWDLQDPTAAGLCPIQPLPSPRLSQLSAVHQPEDSIGPLVLMFQIVGFDLASMGPESVGLTRLARRHEQLLSYLRPETLDNTVLRMRAPRFAHESALFESLVGDLGRRLPRSSGPVDQMLDEAGFVVIPRLFSTTFLECLATDTPVMILDESFPHNVKREFLPLYEQLRAAGILTTEPRVAAQIISSIYPDGVQEWWLQHRELVASVADFLARTSSSVRETWLEEVLGANPQPVAS